jgi:hypothetical protein
MPAVWLLFDHHKVAIRLVLVVLAAVLIPGQLKLGSADLAFTSVLLAPFTIVGALLGVMLMRRAARASGHSLALEAIALAGAVGATLAVLIGPMIIQFIPRAGLLTWMIYGDNAGAFRGRLLGVLSNGFLQGLLISMGLIALGATSDIES